MGITLILGNNMYKKSFQRRLSGQYLLSWLSTSADFISTARNITNLKPPKAVEDMLKFPIFQLI